MSYITTASCRQEEPGGLFRALFGHGRLLGKVAHVVAQMAVAIRPYRTAALSRCMPPFVATEGCGFQSPGVISLTCGQVYGEVLVLRSLFNALWFKPSVLHHWHPHGRWPR